MEEKERDLGRQPDPDSAAPEEQEDRVKSPSGAACDQTAAWRKACSRPYQSKITKKRVETL